MSFNSAFFIRSASLYFSPYSSSSNSSSSSSTSASLSSLGEPEKFIEHPNQFLRSKVSDEASLMGYQNHQLDPTLYEASPPRRFVVPEIIVTTVTPIAPLPPPYSPPKNGSTDTTTLYPPNLFAREVTKPISQPPSTLLPQPPTSITLTPPYDFYYPSQPRAPPPPTLDPHLLTPPHPAHTYSSLLLPQLHDLTLTIASTMDTHLMRHLSPLSSLLALLNPLPDFGLLTHNLPAFRAHVESHFSTVRTKEEQYFHTLLAVAPEPELKMVLRIFDDWYIYKFPRRAGCLIFPDDFEDQPAQPAGEMDSEDSEESESACHFPDRDEGAVDVDVDVGADTEVPALVYRQGWGWKPKYVVTASFAGDVGVQYPLYHF